MLNPEVGAGAWLIGLPALFSGVLVVLASLHLDALGASGVAVGAVFLGAGIVEAILTPLLGRLSDRRGRMAPIRVGLAAGTVVALLLTLPDSIAAVAVLVAAAGATLASFWGPAGAMLSEAAERVGLDQGLAFALTNLAWSTGQVVGGSGGAALADATSDAVPYAVLASLYLVTWAAVMAGRRRGVARTAVSGFSRCAQRELELDLDVFAGPFDLLLAVVLREEISLLEVELGDDRGRLPRPPRRARRARPRGGDRVPRPDRGPAGAEVAADAAPADEEESRPRRRRRPPTSCSRGCSSTAATGRRPSTCASCSPTTASTCTARAAAARSAPRLARGRRPHLRRPTCSARRSATCCGAARARHEPHPPDRLAGAPAAGAARAALAAAPSFDFDEVFADEDRLTQAVTLFALLEMHSAARRPGARAETFGPIEVRGGSDDQARLSSRGRRGAALPLARAGAARRAGRGLRGERGRGRQARSSCSARSSRRAARRRAARGRGRLHARRRPDRRATPPGSCWRSPRTPPLTQAQAETLAIVAYLQPVSRPEIARIRGVSSESAVRRSPSAG